MSFQGKDLGIVFVIDCHDQERMTLAKDALFNVLEKFGRTSSIPIIIAANKQDLTSMKFPIILLPIARLFSP